MIWAGCSCATIISTIYCALTMIIPTIYSAFSVVLPHLKCYIPMCSAFFQLWNLQSWLLFLILRIHNTQDQASLLLVNFQNTQIAHTTQLKKKNQKMGRRPK